MEHIFETVYPDYKEFKENIDKIHNEFIFYCKKYFADTQKVGKEVKSMRRKERRGHIQKKHPAHPLLATFMGVDEGAPVSRVQALKAISTYVGEHELQVPTNHRTFYCKGDLNNLCPERNTMEFTDIMREIKPFFSAKRIDPLFQEFIKKTEYGFISFKVICKIEDTYSKDCKYFDNYGNCYLRNSDFINFNYRIIDNKNLDLRFNNSYFNFFMFQKYPCINIVTFYEDNAVLIERIKELYYSLPHIKIKNEEKNNFEEIKNEEKNKFEEIQKELIELKNQLKIKDEEISKIKDDLDDKNKLLKKILTKL